MDIHETIMFIHIYMSTAVRLARCQYTVTKSDGKFHLQRLSVWYQR